MRGIYIYSLLLFTIIIIFFSIYINADIVIFKGLTDLDNFYKSEIRAESWSEVSRHELEDYLNNWSEPLFEDTLPKQYVDVNFIESNIQSILSNLSISYDSGKFEYSSEDLIDINITDVNHHKDNFPISGKVVLDEFTATFTLRNVGGNIIIDLEELK